MHTAARESYTAVVARLDAYASTAIPDRIAAAGDDVLAVAELLRREPRLRRALADTSREAADRAGLLAAVLTGKIGEDALGLLSALAAGRWSTPGELLEAAERLGVEALLASAERAGALGDVEDQLFRFGRVVDGNRDLAAALSDSTTEVGRRVALTGTLLAGKAHRVTVRLTEQAVRGFGGRRFDGALTRLVELAAARRDRQVAYVTTAAALTDDEEQRLAARLSQLYGRQISLQARVDPSIIGGVRVQVGADLYDGTVVSRLAQARKAMAG